MDEEFEQRTLPPGTTVHLKGIPLRLDADTLASTHPNNWAMAGEKPSKNKDS